MNRVSSATMNNDMQYWLRRTEDNMASTQTKITRQTKLERLRDDPMAAARSVRYESVSQRLSQYEDNVLYAKDRAYITEGYMSQSQEILQRIRELAVTGATGTFSKSDSQAMAIEVDQLLSELVSLANAKGPDGDYLFAGDKAKTEPFRALKGYVDGSGSATTTKVQYMGGIGSPKAEISENTYIPMNLPGDAVFWAERQRISSEKDAQDFRVMKNSSIFIDGQEISLKTGDTVQAVIAKINDSGAAVKASLDPVKASFVLEGADAHRIRLEDSEEGTVFQDLGILKDTKLPSDYNNHAKISGGSIFDTVMSLRDALYKGDHIDVGGRVLGGIDSALDNMGRRLAEAGSIVERVSTTASRLNKEIPDVTKLLANEKDIDMAKAITDFKMAEYAHTATLQMAGKVLQKSLLDFLR